MELILLLILTIGGIVYTKHPKTQDQPFALWIRKVVRSIGDIFKTKQSTPSSKAVPKTVRSASSEHGNVPRVKGELDQDPPTKGLHAFPVTGEAVTRFEEFNAKLFVFEVSETLRWDKSRDNDYVTRLSGDLNWLKQEIRKRLRPGYPVLFDPFGQWAGVSEQLELDPNAYDPIAEAYLNLPRPQRPVVISQRVSRAKAQKTEKAQTAKPQDPQAYTLYRYGFVDYEFDRKFLEGYPEDLLKGLLQAFSGPEKDWEAFSPARLRQSVLEQNREEEDHRQTLEAHQHENRFAALWNLKDEPPKREAVDALRHPENAEEGQDA